MLSGTDRDALVRGKDSVSFQIVLILITILYSIHTHSDQLSQTYVSKVHLICRGSTGEEHIASIFGDLGSITITTNKTKLPQTKQNLPEKHPFSCILALNPFPNPSYINILEPSLMSP